MKNLYLYIIPFIFYLNGYSQKEFQSKSSNPNILVGCWWFPHFAPIQIHFKKDQTFIFNDVDDKVLKGRYYINKGVIKLEYYDRKPQKFILKYFIDTEGNPYYSIYKKDYVFVKDIENTDCNW